MALCTICGGVGLVGSENGSRPCACQRELEIGARLKRAQIPAGFHKATLANFKPAKHTERAHRMAMKFAAEFIPGKTAAGLLFAGTVGTGKTHLAAGLLRTLVESKGVEARFVDVRELLDRLRSSYANDAGESHGAILKPILDADLVVVDELGAARPNDWVFETIELLIGGLYNRATPVIVTTNLKNLAAGARDPRENEYSRAAREETLGERIGMRMWSRLQQMCAAVEMTGPDWRARR